MPGKYTVVFKFYATPKQIETYFDNIYSHGGNVTHRYNVGLITSIVVKIPDAYMSKLRELQSSPNSPVDYIEPCDAVTIRRR